MSGTVRHQAIIWTNIDQGMALCGVTRIWSLLRNGHFNEDSDYLADGHMRYSK